MPEPEEIEQAKDLVRAIILDKWTKEDMLEYVMDNLGEAHFKELLAEAKREGYCP